MTRRDYVALSEALRWSVVHGKATPQALEQHRLDTLNIANRLAVNLGFDRDRFIRDASAGLWSDQHDQ